MPTQGGRAPSWAGAITRSDLPSSAKLVALVLDTFLNRQTETAWPSVPTLAERASISRPTATKALRTLEAAGWLSREPRKNPKTGAPSSFLYRPRIPPSALKEESHLPPEEESHLPGVGKPLSTNLSSEGEIPPTEVSANGKVGPPKEQQREIFIALAGVWGSDLKTMTAGARQRIGKVIPSLWAAGVPEDAVHPDGTPYSMGEMVTAFGVWWRRAYPESPCPPQTVEREYPRFCSGDFQHMATVAEEERESKREARRRMNGR